MRKTTTFFAKKNLIRTDFIQKIQLIKVLHNFTYIIFASVLSEMPIFRL